MIGFVLPLLTLALASPAQAQQQHPPVKPHAAPARRAVASKPAARRTASAHPATAHPATAAHPAKAQPAAPPAPPAVSETPAAPAEPAKGTSTGLVLPRFASLKTDEVNLRSGPGLRYPIEWVYKRRELPVEIEREFEVWRLVEDPDGVKGWVHQATLVGRRTFMVTGGEHTIRAEASDAAAATARVMPGVIGRLRACAANAGWCQVQVGDYRGWLKRDAFWGAFNGEAVQ